jgi:hypothetical protein
MLQCSAFIAQGDLPSDVEMRMIWSSKERKRTNNSARMDGEEKYGEGK